MKKSAGKKPRKAARVNKTEQLLALLVSKLDTMAGAGADSKGPPKPIRSQPPRLSSPSPSPIDILNAEAALFAPGQASGNEFQFSEIADGITIQTGDLSDPSASFDVPDNRENRMALLTQIHAKLEVMVNKYRELEQKVLEIDSHFKAMTKGKIRGM